MLDQDGSRLRVETQIALQRVKITALKLALVHVQPFRLQLRHTMMTALLPSLECIPPPIRDRPRFVGDHVIRHYRPLGLAALLRDLGADPATPELEIIGGIGRLVLRADGRDTWEPTSTREPPPAPLPADPTMAIARVAICSACESWQCGKCAVAGCGCSGQGQPARAFSKCPRDLWPSALPSAHQ